MQSSDYENTKYRGFSIGIFGLRGKMKLHVQIFHKVTVPFFQKQLEGRRPLFVKDSSCSEAFAKFQRKEILLLKHKNNYEWGLFDLYY